MIEIFFKGETLADILPKIRKFLGDVSISPEDALLALDEPLPPAVKRTSKKREGEPTKGQVEAARDASAPPCSRDDVANSLRAYMDRFDAAAAVKHGTKLMGALRISDIPETKLWRAKAALDAAVAADKPAGI